jgi:hypothetical protein
MKGVYVHVNGKDYWRLYLDDCLNVKVGLYVRCFGDVFLYDIAMIYDAFMLKLVNPYLWSLLHGQVCVSDTWLEIHYGDDDF